MNQELMTLDFWQDTVIYEGKTFPVGTLACDALNVPADTITKMNEQCEKINLLLGMLNAGQDTSALFPMAKEAALTMLELSLIHILPLSVCGYFLAKSLPPQTAQRSSAFRHPWSCQCHPPRKSG